MKQALLVAIVLLTGVMGEEVIAKDFTREEVQQAAVHYAQQWEGETRERALVKTGRAMEIFLTALFRKIDEADNEEPIPMDPWSTELKSAVGFAILPCLAVAPHAQYRVDMCRPSMQWMYTLIFQSWGWTDDEIARAEPLQDEEVEIFAVEFHRAVNQVAEEWARETGREEG